MCGINTYIHAWTPSKTLHIHASYFAFLYIYNIHTCVHASLVISQHIHFIHVSCLTDITNIQQSLCWNISIHRPKKSFRRLPGNHFEAFPVPYQKLLASISANRAHALTEVFKASFEINTYIHAWAHSNQYIHAWFCVALRSSKKQVSTRLSGMLQNTYRN